MRRVILLIGFFFYFAGAVQTHGSPALPLDVFWLDEYGALRWEDEKARLDNFAITLIQQPNFIGYIYIWAGHRSCANEAVDHAIKVKRYLTKVRNVPWNRVAFRDVGYRDDFGVKLWLFPSGHPPGYVPDYQPASSMHVIQKCQKKRTVRE